MTKLSENEVITDTTYIKAFSASKCVPVKCCIGMIVKEISPYMESDFEGFFKGAHND